MSELISKSIIDGRLLEGCGSNIDVKIRLVSFELERCVPALLVAAEREGVQFSEDRHLQITVQTVSGKWEEINEKTQKTV